MNRSALRYVGKVWLKILTGVVSMGVGISIVASVDRLFGLAGIVALLCLLFAFIVTVFAYFEGVDRSYPPMRRCGWARKVNLKEKG